MWYGILIGVAFWQLCLFVLSAFHQDEEIFTAISAFLFYVPTIVALKIYKWLRITFMAATHYAATIYMFPEDKPPLSYGSILIRKRDRKLYQEDIEFPEPDAFAIEIEDNPRLLCYRYAPLIHKGRIIIRKSTVASDMLRQAAEVSGWVSQNLYKVK